MAVCAGSESHKLRIHCERMSLTLFLSASEYFPYELICSLFSFYGHADLCCHKSCIFLWWAAVLLTELAEWAVYVISNSTCLCSAFVCVHTCVYTFICNCACGDKCICTRVCICSVWKLSGSLALLVADGNTAWMPFLLHYAFELPASMMIRTVVVF